MTDPLVARATTYLGRHVVTCGPDWAEGCMFRDLQLAIDYASVFPDGDRVDIMLAPGDYPNVLCRRDRVYLVDPSGIGLAHVESWSLSNATLASITTFNGSGDPNDLVLDGALTSPPSENAAFGVRFERTVNNPAWVGDAIASVRFLGAPVAGSTFGQATFGLVGCFIESAAGSAAGYGGIYACYSNLFGLRSMIGGGGIKHHNCTGCFLLHCLDLANLHVDYDSADPEPLDVSRHGMLATHSAMAELRLTGDLARISGLLADVLSIWDIVVDDAANVETSILNFPKVRNNINVTNLGHTLILRGPRHMALPIGAGAAGVVVAVGFGS